MPYRARDLEFRLEPAPTPDAATRWAGLVKLIARAQQRKEATYEELTSEQPPARGEGRPRVRKSKRQQAGDAV